MVELLTRERKACSFARGFSRCRMAGYFNWVSFEADGYMIFIRLWLQSLTMTTHLLMSEFSSSHILRPPWKDDKQEEQHIVENVEMILKTWNVVDAPEVSGKKYVWHGAYTCNDESKTASSCKVLCANSLKTHFSRICSGVASSSSCIFYDERLCAHRCYFAS